MVSTDLGLTGVAWCIILHRSHEVRLVLACPESRFFGSFARLFDFAHLLTGLGEYGLLPGTLDLADRSQ